MQFMPKRIAPGAGKEIPDKYVAKVVDSWLMALLKRNADAWVEVSRLTKGKGGFGGNPSSQQKKFNLLKQGFKDIILMSSMQAGKRARYNVVFDELTPGRQYLSDPDTHGMSTLYCVRHHMVRNGVNHEANVWEEVIFAYTRHALCRIISRTEIENYDELHTFVYASWHNLALLELVTRELRENKSKPMSWSLPIRSIKDDRMIVLIVSVHPDTEMKLHVVTVYADDFLSPKEWDDCCELLVAMEAVNPLDVGGTDMGPMFDLVMKCEREARPNYNRG